MSVDNMNVAILSAVIAATVISISPQDINCTKPPQTFRQFYADRHGPGGPHWSGYQSETITDVVKRVLDDVADFEDYRTAWSQQCSKR